jgi:hypothetical protein
MDPHHFGKLGPDPGPDSGPHQSVKLDPDPHQSEKQDPNQDPYQSKRWKP